MTNQKLVQTALRVLRRPGVMSINFELAGLLVTGVRLRMVAKAIEDGAISCVVADKATMNQKSGLSKAKVVLAKYVSEDDTVYFPREDYGISDGFEQSVIVHESVHAMFDLYAKSRNDTTLGWDEECTAVIAAAYFMRLGEPEGQRTDDILDRSAFRGGLQHFGMDDTGRAAFRIVDDLMAQTHDFQTDHSTKKIELQNIHDLRTAVANDWEFLFTRFPDGSTSDTTRVPYFQQGVAACNPAWWNKPFK